MAMKNNLLIAAASMLLVGMTSVNADTTMQSVGNGISDAAQSVGTVMDDTAITTFIKAQFVKEPSLSAFKIGVETDKGVVTLSGTVENSAEYQRAVDIATKTDGVKSVNSKELVIVAPTTN